MKLADDLGWSYNVSDTPNERGEVFVELEKYSPQDQDFIATIWFENENEQDFIDKLRNYWEDYDPDEEAVAWVGDYGHGKTVRLIVLEMFLMTWKTARVCSVSCILHFTTRLTQTTR